MDSRTDILTDENGLVRVENNDLVFGESDTQHIQDTINAAPGWWKEHPSDGVNISSFVKSAGKEQVISRLIKINLQNDLYPVGVPSVYTDPAGKMKINPNVSV